MQLYTKSIMSQSGRVFKTARESSVQIMKYWCWLLTHHIREPLFEEAKAFCKLLFQRRHFSDVSRFILLRPSKAWEWCHPSWSTALSVKPSTGPLKVCRIDYWILNSSSVHLVYTWILRTSAGIWRHTTNRLIEECDLIFLLFFFPSWST